MHKNTIVSVFTILYVASFFSVTLQASIVINSNSDYDSVRRAQARRMATYMDNTTDPCDDFFKYACGNWAKIHPIPDYIVDYEPIVLLVEQIDEVVKDLLAGEIDNDVNDAETKAKQVYMSCINQGRRNQLGVKPIVEFMESLGGWPVLSSNWSGENFDWLKTVAIFRRYNDQILVKEVVGLDKNNSDHYIIYLDQPRLGLSSRFDYLYKTYSYRIQGYRKFIKQVLELFGVTSQQAADTADELIVFETELARISSSPKERFNLNTFTRRISLSELEEKVSEINWTRYLNLAFERTIEPFDLIVIKELNYMRHLSVLVASTETRIVANYIFWRFVQYKVGRLSDDFVGPLQEFYKVMVGRKRAPAKWKQCVDEVSNHMGMAVGAMFIKRHFNEKSRNDVAQMVHNVKEAFHRILNTTDWLDDYTRSVIKMKLNKMIHHIGYPDFIISEEFVSEMYSSLEVDPNNYFQNFLNMLQYSSREKHGNLLKVDNRSDWGPTSPAVVNGFYSPVKNKIVIPAALLQQPLYHQHFPKALNYGTMGLLLGHEITHAFDSEGRHYDLNGNLRTWWNQTFIDRFNERAQCILDQYSQYKIAESKLFIDSRSTQPENIADNAGLDAAFRAYMTWKDLQDSEILQSETLPELEGMTSGQLFYLSFAQLWCGYTRPEAILSQIRQDPHSPGMFRVIGTLSNSEDFAREYNCSAGSKMSPEKKCKIW